MTYNNSLEAHEDQQAIVDDLVAALTALLKEYRFEVESHAEDVAVPKPPLSQIEKQAIHALDAAL